MNKDGKPFVPHFQKQIENTDWEAIPKDGVEAMEQMLNSINHFMAASSQFFHNDRDIAVPQPLELVWTTTDLSKGSSDTMDLLIARLQAAINEEGEVHGNNPDVINIRIKLEVSVGPEHAFSPDTENTKLDEQFNRILREGGLEQYGDNSKTT